MADAASDLVCWGGRGGSIWKARQAGRRGRSSDVYIRVNMYIQGVAYVCIYVKIRIRTCIYTCMYEMRRLTWYAGGADAVPGGRRSRLLLPPFRREGIYAGMYPYLYVYIRTQLLVYTYINVCVYVYTRI